MTWTTWAPMEVDGVFDCPCGDHPILGLSLRDGGGWLAILLSADEAVSLDLAVDPISAPVTPLQAAVEVGAPAAVRVRLARGPRGGLLGVVDIDADGAEMGIRVDASEAVALAVCRRVAIEVPETLVCEGSPPPWGGQWVGGEVIPIRRERGPDHADCPATSWGLEEEPT